MEIIIYLPLLFLFQKQKTGQSEKIAYEKARTDAFGMIRRFAGAKIQSKTEKTVEQIFNEYKNEENRK